MSCARSISSSNRDSDKCEAREFERHEEDLPSVNASCFEDHALVDMVHVSVCMNSNQHEMDLNRWEYRQLTYTHHYFPALHRFVVIAVDTK